MTGIQQEQNIYQNLFIIQMFGLHLYKGKLKLLSWLLSLLVYLSTGISGGTTNIQTILDRFVCSSDEMPFLVSRVVILHIFRIWRNKNPHVICELERDSAKLNMWCELMRGRVIKFFFFSEPTMTMGLYLDMLELYAVLQLPCGTLTQQYGALPHYSHVIRKHFNHTMSGGWVSKGTSVAWPPPSPDVTPLDPLCMGLCG